MDHLIRHHIAFSAQDILHRSSTAIRPYIVLPASMAFADLQAPPFFKEIMDANPRFSTSFDFSEFLLF